MKRAVISEVRERLEETINQFSAAELLAIGATTGDITPEQTFELDDLLDRLAELLTEQVNQNAPDAVKTVQYILPTYLAGYLINGDGDGLHEQEAAEADAFCEKHKVRCISVAEDNHFSPNNDLWGYRLGSDVSTFTFIQL